MGYLLKYTFIYLQFLFYFKFVCDSCDCDYVNLCFYFHTDRQTNKYARNTQKAK